MRPLFIYGTLMAGQPQGGLLKGFARTRATIRGSLYRLPQGYPAVALDGAMAVHGELVSDIDPRRMTLLDGYEGVEEGLYARVECTAIVGLRQVAAQVYVMHDPVSRGGVLLPHGRWRGAIKRAKP